MNPKFLVLGTVALAALVILATLGATRPIVEAHGIVDQEWPTEGLSFHSGGSRTILPHDPIGMEFTPSVPSLVAVDVSLSAMGDDGDATITVQVREDTIAGNVLATSSQVVPEDIGHINLSPQFFHFDLTQTASVQPGRKYVIQVTSTNNSHGWNGAEGATEYDGGEPIVGGQLTDGDFFFRTYGEGVAPPSPSPVPTVTPAPSGATLQINSATAPLGGDAHVAILALDVPPPGLGVWSIDFQYDTSVVVVAGCVTLPTAFCKTEFASGTVRMNGVAPEGLVGNNLIASYWFRCFENASTSPVELSINTFASADDPPGPIDPLKVRDGSITCSAVGDVSCDNVIDGIDAVLVLQSQTSLLDAVPCPENGDPSGDGRIDALDALLILQFVAGLTTNFPANS